MPFVKLDCGILDSTLWFEREARDVFLTALLMAEPFELMAETPQLKTQTLEQTGWMVPAGWYGFVHAAGIGIIRRAGVDPELGYKALEMLGSPENISRSSDFEGRRLVRVDGGYIVLTYMKHRERDYTAADRSRRYRERKASRRSVTASHRNITQAEAEYRVQSTDQDQDQNISSEPKKASASEPPVLEFPIIGSSTLTTWALTPSQVTAWTALYPNLNILAECRKALAWVSAHPDRRKTLRGMPKFLVGWLNRAVDAKRGGPVIGSPKTAGNRAAVEAFIARKLGAP